jgi:hypothetical protein
LLRFSQSQRKPRQAQSKSSQEAENHKQQGAASGLIIPTEKEGKKDPPRHNCNRLTSFSVGLTFCVSLGSFSTLKQGRQKYVEHFKPAAVQEFFLMLLFFEANSIFQITFVSSTYSLSSLFRELRGGGGGNLYPSSAQKLVE